MKNFLKNYKIESWFKAGLIGLLVPFLFYLSSMSDISSGNSKDVVLGLLLLVFMGLANGTIYFFIISTISYYKRFKKLDTYWTKITTIFYIATSLTFFVFTIDKNPIASIIFLPFFPLLYGMFFIQFFVVVVTDHFLTIFSDETKTIIGMVALSSIHLLLFGIWLWLESMKRYTKKPDWLLTLKISILIAIFLMLSIGMVSCAKQIGIGL